MRRAFQLATTALAQTADWEVATAERVKSLVEVYKAKRSTSVREEHRRGRGRNVGMGKAVH